MSYKLSE